jgi:alpha-galactosidase
MYYAFYAQEFNGSVELRGLDNKVYRVIDYVNNIDLGTIKGPNANLYVRFNKFLLIKCVPI